MLTLGIIKKKKFKLGDFMKTERKVIAIVSIALGGLGLILSWIPIVNNIAFIFGVLALILVIIALFSNRKNKKLLSLIGLIISVLTLVIVLVTQSIYGKAIDDIGKNNIKTSSSSKSVKVPKHSTSKKKQTTLELLNQLASTSKSTDEIYVTGEITVGDEQTVSPGIYDLSVTGGSGNITGSRKSVNGMFINWLGGAPGNDSGYASHIRIVLLDGDTLNFSNISKIKFTAVPEKITPSTQLGIGNFIVGRDIPAGNYKLSTNMTMNPQFANLGWTFSIYNDENGNERSQDYNPGNSDVVVSLKDGEIITTSFMNSNYYDTKISDDNAKLIFTTVK